MRPKEESMFTKRVGSLLLGGLLVCALASGAAAEEKKAKTAGAKHAAAGGGKATLMAPDDLKWSDIPNAPAPGLKWAAVEGDPTKGRAEVFMKLPAGLDAPLHHHTPDHDVTVVSGTLHLTVDGKEKTLPPGSWFTFRGKKPHVTKCEAGADCVLFVEMRGPWDVVPEDAAAKK
jgi:quercetin dioxygenase-like cupin family protein